MVEQLSTQNISNYNSIFKQAERKQEQMVEEFVDGGEMVEQSVVLEGIEGDLVEDSINMEFVTDVSGMHIVENVAAMEFVETIPK